MGPLRVLRDDLFTCVAIHHRESMQSVLCVDTHNFSCDIIYKCAPVATSKQRNLPIKVSKVAKIKNLKIPLLTPLLRHKEAQEGRGEILLENSFMR